MQNRRLVIFCGILLAYWGLRLPIAVSVPPFIDESIAIGIGRNMLDTSPLFGASEGRQLYFWYLLGFQPYANEAYFVIRTGIALFLVLNAAGIIAVGRQLAGMRGAVIAVMLFALSPYFLFFGGIAIADTMAVAFLTLAVALTVGLRRKVSLRDAGLVGALLFLMANSKVAYLPYATLPIIGAVLLRPAGRRWLANVRWVAVSLGVFGVLYGGFTAVQYIRGYAPLNILLRGSGDDTGNLLTLITQMLNRIPVLVGIYAGYMGWVATGVALVLLAVHLWRREWFLFAVLVIPGAAVLAAQQFYSRYIYAHVVIVMIIAGVELARLTRQRWGQLAVGAGMLVWVAAVSVPFYTTLQRDAASLNLSRDDFNEYFAADSAGMGISEVIAFLETVEPTQTYGLMANCPALKYSALGVVEVNCPRTSPTGEDIPALRALVEENQGTGVYVVLENSSYLPESVPGEIVLEVARPGGLTTLTVYDTGVTSD